MEDKTFPFLELLETLLFLGLLETLTNQGCGCRFLFFQDRLKFVLEIEVYVSNTIYLQ
jgi:hypothetical protein